VDTPSFRLFTRAGFRVDYAWAKRMNAVMPRLQAFKYAFMPNGEPPRHMRRFAGLCRFVFNPALVFTLSFPRKINIRLCGND
jgi:hypothetical protein